MLIMEPDLKKKTMYPGKIRIIAGRWRGRLITIPDLPGLRPTPNRIRETLFNWLAPHIVGSRCLDLFAGSGALGLEALSRGAGEVVFVDQNQQAIIALRDLMLQLGVGNQVGLYCEPVLTFLRSQKAPFDIIFLDPPFHQNLLLPCCELLESLNLLSENSLVYLEAENTLPNLQLPANWTLYRHKEAGQVQYALVKRQDL